LHVHFHVIVLAGVYVARGEGVAFFASPPPTRDALEALVKRVVARTMKWLRRKKYLREDLGADMSNEHKALSPVEQLAMLAMQRGTFETIRDAEDSSRTRMTLRAPRESQATSSPISVSTFTRR